MQQQPEQQQSTPEPPMSHQTPLPPIAPYTSGPSQASKYSTFYLLILIFTCIYAAFSLLGIVVGIIKHVETVSSHPVLGIPALLGDFAGLLVIPAVILLFLENKWGLWLIFAQTGISTLLGATIAVLASLDVNAFIASSGQAGATATNMGGFVLGALIVGLATSTALSIGWCVLCYFAWKNQQNHRKPQGLAAR